MRRTAALLALLAFVGGCDDTPGVRDPFGRPPIITAFTFSPEEFLLDESAPQAEIPVTVEATVSAADGAPPTVRYLVRPEFGSAPVAEGTLTRGANNRWTAAFTLTLDRGATGLYAVVVYAIGADGREGDRATGLLRFTATSLGPPVVENVEHPETVTRPATFNIVATVSDPDGRSNISRVELRQPGEEPGTSQFLLRDDGGAGSNSGDEVAGDGRFTIRVQVTEDNAPGVYAFEVQAFDRTRQASNVFPISITVE
ncbi:MAG TPA: hypothetical protein VD962_04395 [Rubricoccaceae bacterium]|nr:hypothetical protein [Rubricoccaceae bacterium]